MQNIPVGIPKIQGSAITKPTQAGITLPKKLPATGGKMNVEEFAQKIKAKYPQYESIDNAELAKKMIDKYPQYGDQVDMASFGKISEVVPMQGGIRRGVAGNASLEGTMLEGLQPANKFLNKLNPLGQVTEFIDTKAQSIPQVELSDKRLAVVGQRAANITPQERKSYENAFNEKGFMGKARRFLYGNVDNFILEQQKSFSDIALGDFGNVPEMAVNTPGSAVKTATATARGLTNPFDTVIGLGKLAFTEEGHNAIKDRYGSFENFMETTTKDPVGVASDILTIVQGGAGLASKGAKVAGMTNTASKLGNISNVAGGAADLGLSTAIPKGLAKVSQFGNEVGQKGLLGTMGNTVIKGLVEPTQPLQMAKDIYGKVQEVKPVETIARKILGATDDQSKLFKAQEARTGQLNKSIDWKNLRKQSDMANEEIVRYGYKPTDTATRAEAHANTMQRIRDEEIKARIGNEFDIDLNNVADKIDEFVAKQTDAGLVKNKAQLAELQAQSKAFREMGTVDGAKGEFIKEMINAQINNWGDASIGDVYKNGMKEATRQLGTNLDEAFSRIPGEFADAKKRFGALKATYADVVKADIKAQKAKGAGLAETFSRIEGFGDLASGIFGMFTGKNPIPQLASGLGKLAVGKVLQKIKDKDFLIQEGFEGLSKKAGQIAPVIKAETNRKALPMIEGSMEFQTPTARIGNTQPRGVGILETGMENVKQPTTQAPLTPTKAPLAQSTKTAPKLPIAKKTPLKQASESVVEDSLLTEAKKYKTADEFVEKYNKLDDFTETLGDGTEISSKVTLDDGTIVYMGKMQDGKIGPIKSEKGGKILFDNTDTILNIQKKQLRKIREQAQTGKTTPTRLPALRTDTPKLSPKTPKVLKPKTPLSKVDDALLDFSKPMKSDDILNLEKLQYSGDEGFQKIIDEFNINLKESNVIDDILLESDKSTKLLADIMTDPKGFKIDNYKLKTLIEKFNKTQNSETLKQEINSFVEQLYKDNGITDDLAEKYYNSSVNDAKKIINDLKGKADDALPVGEKMKLYHGTNKQFDSFSNDKLREGAFGKGLYVTSNKDSAQRRGNAAKIAQGGDVRVIDIDIPEGTKFKAFDNETDFTNFVKDDFAGDKKKAIDFLQKNYDGLNIKEGTLKANSGTYVIFDPEKLLQPNQPTTLALGKPLPKVDDSLLVEASKYKSADEFVKDNILYRGETGGGGNYYSTDFEFARDFAPTGKESEVIKRGVLKTDIYKKDILPFAGSEDEITKALSEAKKKGKKAILVSEGKNQPNSVFVFDKSALKTEEQLRKIREEANRK